MCSKALLRPSSCLEMEIFMSHRNETYLPVNYRARKGRDETDEGRKHGATHFEFVGAQTGVC